MEVLQVIFQVFIIKYLFLYIHGDSFNFLALALAQFGLFFITSILVALLFYSYTGTRRLQLLLTFFNVIFPMIPQKL
ncbi:hypothetical protein B9Z55_011380 [Caenorhabditis nigoni]|nr:hypothetical protein B9Z55_011380 [Caenorhabditis nigoni]